MNLESKTLRLEATQAVNPFDNELAYAQECYHEVESFGLFLKRPANLRVQAEDMMLMHRHGKSFVVNSTLVGPSWWRKAQREKLKESLVVVNHGWQRESTNGPKGDWSCVVFWGWLPWLHWSPRPQRLDVVWCSAVAVVV